MPDPSPSTPNDSVQAAIISEEAAKEAGEAGMDSEPPNSTKSKPTPTSSATETPAVRDPKLTPGSLEDQLRANIVANRSKRWAAFVMIGVVVAVFFLLLLAAFCKLFFGTYLVAVLGAAGQSWQWHVLVFLGVALALLAAIPLSLSLAIVRMISDKDSNGDSSEIKTPSVELARALADMCKSIAGAIKN